jgi:hypothetical protein
MASTQDPDELIRRSFYNLSALRSNVPKGYIERKYADQFHHALNQLEQPGFDVQEWRISSSAMLGFERKDLFIKMDAVLGYFRKPYEKIRFTGPKK